MPRWLILALVIAPAALLLAACGGGEGQDATASPTGGDRPSPSAKVSIQALDPYFQPSQITGTFGQAMEVTVKNEGKAPHTFTIDELRVDQEVAPGKSITIKLSPAEPGEFNFYCKYHVASGMRGSLLVQRRGGAATPAAAPSASPSPKKPSAYY